MLPLVPLLIAAAHASGQIVVRADRPCIVVVNMVPYPTSGGEITVTIPDGNEGDQNVRIRNLLGEQQWAGKVEVPHDHRVLLKWELGYMNVDRPEPLRATRPKLSDRGIVIDDGIDRNAPGDQRRPSPSPQPTVVGPKPEDPFLAAVEQAGVQGGGGALPTEVEAQAPAAGGTGGVKLANRTGSWANVRVAGALHEFRGELEKSISLPTGAHPVEIGDFRDKERWWTGELWVYPDFTVELQFSQAAAPAAINREEAWRSSP